MGTRGAHRLASPGGSGQDVHQHFVPMLWTTDFISCHLPNPLDVVTAGQSLEREWLPGPVEAASLCALERDR